MNRFKMLNIFVLTLLLNAAFSSGRALTNLTFIAIDVETSGFTKSDRIIELAAVKFKNGELIEKKCWLINPDIKIPEAATRIHGISDKMVAKCPAFRDIFPEFLLFADKDILIAHNADFDWRFIDIEIRRNNLTPLTNCVIDNLRLARKCFPGIDSHNLTALKQYLTIPEDKAHRALADSISLMKVFLAGMDKLPGTTTLDDLIKLAGINQSGLPGKLSDRQESRPAEETMQDTDRKDAFRQN